MRVLKARIREALVSALPITLIVYLVALLPGFSFTRVELITFTVGAILLVLGIGLFSACFRYRRTCNGREQIKQYGGGLCFFQILVFLPIKQELI